MRGIIVMAMFVASLAHAGWREYQETRNLELAAGGLAELNIDAGAGQLDVLGVEGLTDIVVVATIKVEGGDDKAREYIAKRLELALERNGDVARLVADFRDGFERDPQASIHLDIRMPNSLPLNIDDSSGSATIADVIGDIHVDDGSGSLSVSNAGMVVVDDGSGSIRISDASGDVHVTDGSGSMTIERVGGSVTIDDGSGSIRVDGVGKDLVIEDDGSGSVRYANVRGSIVTES